jgi:SsrA-binding protein
MPSSTYFLHHMKVIANNRKAYHNLEVLEKVEAGIALTGSEVKSIRAGHVNLSESFAQVVHGEVILNNLQINPYEHNRIFKPDPFRKRRLLLHKREIGHLFVEVERKNLALVPLSMYFKEQWVKIELGLCRGRKKWDKRQKIADDESKRRLAKLMNLRRG